MKNSKISYLSHLENFLMFGYSERILIEVKLFLKEEIEEQDVA
jgi:hypothetical protein